MTTPTEARQLIEEARRDWALEPGEEYPVGEQATILALASALEAFLPKDEIETVEQFKAEVLRERQRQVVKGYSSQHDDEHGIDHLFDWAGHYAYHGNLVKSQAMVEAARGWVRRNVSPVTREAQEPDNMSDTTKLTTEQLQIRERLAYKLADIAEHADAEEIWETLPQWRIDDLREMAGVAMEFLATEPKLVTEHEHEFEDRCWCGLSWTDVHEAHFGFPAPSVTPGGERTRRRVMTHDEAIAVIAADAAWKLLADADEDRLGQWEEYPELSEHDWEQVVEAVAGTASARPATDDFQAAYELLAAGSEFWEITRSLVNQPTPASTWRQRFEVVSADLIAARAENVTLRAALDELNAEYEDMFNDASQGDNEKAKTHAIKRLRSALKTEKGK